jgi:peptide deformylase
MREVAIRKIARLGHPVLRQVAHPVPEEAITGDEVQRLIKDLLDTVLEYEGVGLAAPQIFDSRRVFVMYEGTGDDRVPRPRPTVWVNPQLTFADDDIVDGWEGCLSIPDLRGQVGRHRSVLVTGFDAQGRARRVRYEGFPAIVAQHEYDHLDGIVFVDRMSDMHSLSFLKEFERYWLPAETAEAADTT